MVRGLGSALDNLGKSAGGVLSPFGQLAQMAQAGFGLAAGQAIFSGVGAALNAASGAAIGFNSQVQRSTIAFTALAGGADRANSFMAQLKDTAATTSFNFPDLLKGSQLFAGMGMNIEQVIPLMKDISTVAQSFGAGAQQINQINLALAQMSARGKVNAQDMNQLANAGIAGWELLSKSMNLPIAKLQEMSEKGQLSSQELLNAIHKAAQDPKLQEMAAEMNKSWDTAISNIEDRFTFLVSGVTKPAFERISQMLNEVSDAMGSSGFVAFGDILQRQIGEALDALLPLKQGFDQAFASFGDSGNLTKLLGDMAAQVTVFGQEMFGGGQTLVTELFNGMVAAWNDSIGILAEIAGSIADFFIGHSPVPEGPLRGMSEGGRKLIEEYISGMQPALEGLHEVTGGIFDDFKALDGTLSLEAGRDGIQAATGNMAALKAEAEQTDDAIRTIDGRLKDQERLIRDQQDAIKLVNDAYDAAEEPLQRSLDKLKQQNDLASRQLDLQDRIQLAQLKGAERDAMGDPIKRAEKQSQLDTLQMSKDELELKIRDRELSDQQRGKKTTDDRQLAALRAQALDMDRQENRLKQDLAGMVDKVALATAKQQEAELRAAGETRQIEEDKAKLRDEALALPIEQKIREQEQARKDELKPLTDQLTAMQQQHDTLQETRAQYGLLKQDIADLIQPLAAAEAEAKKVEAAAKRAAKEAGPPTVASLIPKQALNPIPKTDWNDVAHQAAQHFLDGLKTNLTEQGPTIMASAFGAIVGGMAFGPIGALFGAQLAPAIKADVEKRLAEAGLTWDDVGKGIQAAIDTLKVDFGPAFASMAAGNFNGALDQLGVGFKDLETKFSGWFTEKMNAVDWDKVFSNTGTLASHIVTWVGDAFKALDGPAMFSEFGAAWDRAVAATDWTATGKKFGDTIGIAITAAIRLALDVGGGIVAAIADVMLSGIQGKEAQTAIGRFAQGFVPAVFKAIVAGIVAGEADLWNQIARAMHLPGLDPNTLRQTQQQDSHLPDRFRDLPTPTPSASASGADPLSGRAMGGITAGQRDQWAKETSAAMEAAATAGVAAFNAKVATDTTTGPVMATWANNDVAGSARNALGQGGNADQFAVMGAASADGFNQGLQGKSAEMDGNVFQWFLAFVIASAKKALRIASPSAEFEDIGVSVVDGLWQGISASASAFVGNIGTWVDVNVITPVKNLLGIQSPSTVFAQIGTNVIDGLWSGISDAVKGFATNWQGFWTGEPDGVIPRAQAMPGEFLQVGKDIVGNLQSGIDDELGRFEGWFKDHFVNLIPDWAKKLLGIQSPSAVFAEIGGNIVRGLEKGISDRFPDTESVLKKLLGGLVDMTKVGTGVVQDYIAQAAAKRGIDPNVALAVVNSEGGFNPGGWVGDHGSSFGPFQLHYGGMAGGGNEVGGLGEAFTRQTGEFAGDMDTWRDQVDFALDQAKAGGWGPWHGWTGDRWAGIENRREGGLIDEHVVGIGLRTGKRWEFGEGGVPELVTPVSGLRRGGRTVENGPAPDHITYDQRQVTLVAIDPRDMLNEYQAVEERLERLGQR
jgi:tape measure domain-containing protein